MREPPTIALLGHETPLEDSFAPARVRALLGEAALRGVKLCFIQSRDCDMATGQITASQFTEGCWRRSAVTLPALVVAAAPTTRAQHRAVEEWFRTRTRLLAFDGRPKHEVAAVLARCPEAAPHLIPEEVLVAGRLEAQLLDWLAGGAIVVKRSDGSLGTGLFFVVPAATGFLVVNDTRSWEGDAAEAVARVAGAIRGRMTYRTYIVQRFVDTRDTAGQPATIRADIARQPDDSWQLYRLTGRIAIGARLVSNRAKGSAMVDAESFLAARGAVDAEAGLERIHALASSVAGELSRSAGLESCYEFGLDFAPDRDQHIWFIEANHRPLTHGAEIERAGHVLTYWTSLLT
ncbi:YheC/YheD family protein [Ancylobacter sp.]|uniref:YheC/YheD family protein n=1 Tax=Ancylobacter sp. TaxID=1872567 RepID=UPI003D108D27